MMSLFTNCSPKFLALYLCVNVYLIHAGATSSSLSIESKLRNALLDQDLQTATELIDDLPCDEPSRTHVLIAYAIKFGNELMLKKLLHRLQQNDKNNFTKYLRHHVPLTSITRLQHYGAGTLSPTSLVLLTHDKKNTKVEVKDRQNNTVAYLDHIAVPETVLWDPTGAYIITMSPTQLKLWNGKKPWNLIFRFSTELDREEGFTKIVWSPSCKLFAVLLWASALSSEIRFYNLNGERISRLNPRFSCRTFKWVNEDELLILGDKEELWDRRKNKRIHMFTHFKTARNFAKRTYAQPTQKGFNVFDWNDNFQYSLDHEDARHITSNPFAAINRAKWDRDGKYLVSARWRYWGSHVKVFNAEGTVMSSFYVDHIIYKIRWNPNGHLFFLIGGPYAEIRDITGSLIATFSDDKLSKVALNKIHWLWDGSGFYIKIKGYEHLVYQLSGTLLDWAVASVIDGNINKLKLIVELYTNVSQSLSPHSLKTLCAIANRIKDSKPDRYFEIVGLVKELIEKKACLTDKQQDPQFFDHQDEDIEIDAAHILTMKKELLKCLNPAVFPLVVSNHFYEILVHVLKETELQYRLTRYLECYERTKAPTPVTEKVLEDLFGEVRPPLKGIKYLIAYYVDQIEKPNVPHEYYAKLAEQIQGSTWREITLMIDRKSTYGYKTIN